jgi:hypothetical protein
MREVTPRQWRSEILEGFITIHLAETVILGSEYWGRLDIQFDEIAEGLEQVVNKGSYRESLMDPDRVKLGWSLEKGTLSIQQSSPLGEFRGRGPAKAVGLTIAGAIGSFWDAIAATGVMSGVSPQRLERKRARARSIESLYQSMR